MSDAAMRLGATFNVFDAFELLEAAVRPLQPEVDFVCVVYQTESNFGQPCSKALLPLLERLQAEGLVHELVAYQPRAFSDEEKARLVSKRAESADFGGGRKSDIHDQFFNELSKREAGRQSCAAAGCTHFMPLDADEFFLPEQLAQAKRVVLERGYQGACCLMQTYYRLPTQRLQPPDELNHVAFLYEIADDMPFRLAAPYPCMLDPTRRLESLRRLHIFPRSEIEMHHMSYVRGDMRSKLRNVSNRGNYFQDPEAFLAAFEAWRPGDELAAPHPFFAQTFRTTETVEDAFGVDISRVCCVCCAAEASRCGRCRGVYYCGRACQQQDWARHRRRCASRHSDLVSGQTTKQKG